MRIPLITDDVRLQLAFGSLSDKTGVGTTITTLPARGIQQKLRCYPWDMTITMSSISQLSDHDLLAAARRAASDQRRATAQLIALLTELDTRKLYLGEGCSSLYSYCRQILHLSEHAAYGRIETARAARQFPIILTRLAEGALTLTAVGLLAQHLTPENHLEILEAARHKSKREVEHLVASLHPQSDVPSVVRKLPGPRAGQLSVPAAPRVDLLAEGVSTAPDKGALRIPVVAPRPAEVKPLAPERYKIQFTVSRETYEQLRRVQDLLRHSIPNGEWGSRRDDGAGTQRFAFTPRWALQ